MTSFKPGPSAMSYGSFGTRGGIEPAMHIINSLGLPKKSNNNGSYSSANYLQSSTAGSIVGSASQDTFSGSSHRPVLDFLDTLKYDTQFNPKTHRPTSAHTFTLTTGKSNNNADPMGYGLVRSLSNTAEPRKKQKSKEENSVDPDENNNFMRDRRGRFAPCVDRVAEVDPSERICQLALPKRLPCEYQEDRSVYWVSKRMKPNCGNHTHFETSQRIDELAMPKMIREDCISLCRSCSDESCPCHCYPCPPRDPRCVDWDRLAAPKFRCEPNFRPIQHVRKSALMACPTKRLCKLSAPKPVVDVAKFYLWLWSKKPDTEIKLSKVERLFITKCHMAEMRIMVRCDLDPTTGAGIDAKLAAAVPTIKYALNKGAYSVIIVSNCAPRCRCYPCDPKALSLQPLAKRFEELLGKSVLFLDDCVGYQARALCQDPEPGSVFLLENLAFRPEETGRSIDEKGVEFNLPKEKIDAFRHDFFNLADTYVIDTFREMVNMTNTTIGYPQQEKAYGFKVKGELDSYNSFIVKPRQPMVAIVGGSMKDTYLIIRNLMGIASDIVVGGDTALAFLKALKRTDLGANNITPKMEKKALNLHSRAKDTKTGLLLPSDVVVRRLGSGQYFTILTRDDVDDDFEIVDIGPFTRKCYIKVIEKAETLIWWGEMGSLGDGTSAIAAAFVEAAHRGARTFVADDGTKVPIGGGCDVGLKTHVTEDHMLTAMLLRGKLPKGLAVLNPARKKVKKREPAAPPVSKKPLKYDIPGMEIASGDKIMCVSDIDVEGKNVLIRVDFHVPMQGNKVLNNYRIRMVVPTIKYALKWRARTVVVLGHMGYPDGKREDNLGLKPICDELASLLGHTVVFVPETVGKLPETVISHAHPGTVIMVENVRFHVDETGVGQPVAKSGIMWKAKPVTPEATPQSIAAFCEKLTRLGDVYVNDAFPCLTYDHSSMMGYYLPTRVCGFLVKNELKYMARICNYPLRRLLVVLGGKSFKEKIPILKDLLKEADDIALTGALAVGFLKVYLNMSIGASTFDPAYEQDIRNIINLADYYKCRLFYPVDLVVATNRNGENSKQISITEAIEDNQMVIDIGVLSSSLYSRLIGKSKMIFWVGTAGIHETEAGSKGTKKIMEAIIDVTKNPETNAISIVGGRSTCEFIHRFESAHENFTHLTTGSIAAFRLLTDRNLLAMDTLMPKPSKRPLRMLGAEQVDVVDKRILLRADLDVPIVDGMVSDPFLLAQLAATVKYLLRKGARAVTLLGDRGRPEGKIDADMSLLPVKATLEMLTEQEIFFAEEGVSEATEGSTRTRKLVLVENTKFHPEEEGIKEDPPGYKIKVSYEGMETFRNLLTSFGDIFVNESLTSLHLNLSSVVGIGGIKKVAGPNLKKTLLKFEEIKKTMERPVLAILGGDNPVADLSTLYNILDLVDQVILCGNFALTILKMENGEKVGNFPATPAAAKLIPRVICKARVNNIDIILPVDYKADSDLTEKVVEEPRTPKPELEEGVEEEPKVEKQTLFTVAEGLPDDYYPLDIGPETIEKFSEVIAEAKMIIFHGVVTPYYTMEKYEDGSKAIFNAIQRAVENGSQAVALGMEAMSCLNKLELTEAFTTYSHAVQVFYDMFRGKQLPGLKILEEAPGKPLKKLSIEQMDLTNMRVLMRLDLFVPTVEGVVLDTDKLEEAAPTILFALKKGAKCVVLLGHRGNPNGYRNTYLSMKPLVVDLSQILERPVTLIDRPCSKKAKRILEDPPPGSVFLMENLKFYTAEYGIDAEPRETKKTEDDGEQGENAAAEEAPQEPGATPKAEEEEVEEEVSTVTPSTETISDGEGGKNIDSLMFQLMTPKTVVQFNEDLAACGDVFVNDDVTDVEEELTSCHGFGLAQKGCGLLLANYLSDMDDPEVYNLPGIISLSPAPR